jgi:hypothetical protein
MPQKKTDCKKGNMKNPKKICKMYITKNHDLRGLVKTVPENRRFKIL